MSTDPSTLESLARRYAGMYSRNQLTSAADCMGGIDPEAAAVYARAAEIQVENRALETSLALSDAIGPEVYRMRPNGALPGDGIGLGL